MKKYWVLLIIPLALFCLLFWEFLGEVEECGREYALSVSTKWAFDVVCFIIVHVTIINA